MGVNTETQGTDKFFECSFFSSQKQFNINVLLGNRQQHKPSFLIPVSKYLEMNKSIISSEHNISQEHYFTGKHLVTMP